MFRYSELLGCLPRVLRNGNWYKLERMDRTFFKAVLSYAKTRSKISNSSIIARLINIIGGLENTIGKKITRAGVVRVKEMLRRFKSNGTFEWDPRVRRCLKDPIYAFWEGAKPTVSRKQPCSLR